MADPQVLIVHGLGGSGPDHWQSLLARSLEARGIEVAYPSLPAPDAPELDSWLAALRSELEGLDPERTRAACHSLGSIAWLHLAAGASGRLAEAVLLVAPPSLASGIAEITSFFPLPASPDDVRRACPATRLVFCGDDPYCPEGAGKLYAGPLELAVDEIEGHGHLNTDAGYGAWPDVERWCVDPGAVPIGPRPSSA